MSYSEPLQKQLTDFLSFLGVGFLLGGLYLLSGFFRRLFGEGKRATVVLDLLFCFGAFTVLFGACLALTNGFWRLPELAAAAAGFFVFCRSAGRWLTPPLFAFAALLRTAAARALLPFRRCSTYIRRRAAALKEKRKAARKAKAGERAREPETKTKKHGKKRKKSRKSTCKTQTESV